MNVVLGVGEVWRWLQKMGGFSMRDKITRGAWQNSGDYKILSVGTLLFIVGILHNE